MSVSWPVDSWISLSPTENSKMDVHVTKGGSGVCNQNTAFGKRSKMVCKD